MASVCGRSSGGPVDGGARAGDWRRTLRLPSHWALEGVTAGVARARRDSSTPPASPRSIFVLRNNDLGDLLVVTPLFEALRRRIPEA